MDKKGVALLCLFSIEVFSNTSASTNKFSFTGVAYDIKSNQILYHENHTVLLNDQLEYKTVSVQYIDNTGQVFANKALDFTNNSLSPNLIFNDTRAGSSVNVISENNMLKINYQGVSDSADAMIEVMPMMVVDAGFDQMLLKYWNSLLDQKPFDFQFLAPTRGEFIDFTLTSVFQDQSIVRFRLNPSNFILQLLVDPIMLTYDRNTKRILIYEGLTNIEEAKEGKITGSYYTARIEYQY